MCTLNAGKSYREYTQKRNKIISQRYYCEEKKHRCELKACGMYKRCTYSAKKNYEKWTKAYRDDRRKIMEKLMKGGL